VQVACIPVADDFAEYLEDFSAKLRASGVRVLVDRSDNRMQKKIREHTLDRVPFMILAGERDQSAGTVSFRYRSGEQRNDVPLESAIEEILAAIADKRQV
jgi:threonyl-tRNA synthetase